MRYMRIEDVKTEADANKYSLQKCSYEGQVVGFYTYMAGILVLPILFKKMKRFPGSWEYRLLVGAGTSLVFSYISAKFCKLVCDKRMERELEGLWQ